MVHHNELELPDLKINNKIKYIQYNEEKRNKSHQYNIYNIKSQSY